MPDVSVLAVLAAAVAAFALSAVYYGVALWIGFPSVLWTGAMLHEDTPWKLAAIPGGDWLVKLPAVAVIVSAAG